LLELSFQARLIVLDEPDAAASPDGAVGTVVPPQTFEGTLTEIWFEFVVPFELLAWM
jgi:hypothetical protein